MNEPLAPDRLTDRPSAARIPVLDLLRGLAALAVCLYHFTDPDDGLFTTTDPLRRMTWQGWLGVEVFFVISGFVIPYSMHLRGYRLRDAGGFLVRRLKRLEPPYLACILLILLLNGLWSIVPEMTARSQHVTLPQLLAHFGYLNALLNDEWLNPVFWTLAIEFQFYIFMALALPLLVHRSRCVRIAVSVSMAIMGFAFHDNLALLPHWLPLFAIGVVTFQVFVGLLSRESFGVLLPIVGALSFHLVGGLQTIVGLVTALSILLMASRESPRLLAPLMFLGTVSYSLYLLHIPVGEALIHVASQVEGAASMRYLVLAGALAASIGAAFAFWYTVERPAQVWARTANPKPLTDRNSPMSAGAATVGEVENQLSRFESSRGFDS